MVFHGVVTKSRLRRWLVLGWIYFQLNLAASSTTYTFAAIPKSLDNPFFNATRDGCIDAARVLGVKCLWTAPEQDNPEMQANITLDLIRSRSVDGLAISVDSIQFMTPVIAESVKAGIPVVTFDSDAPDSVRSVYIGTDNNFFGDELGKVLNDLQPKGGTFAVVAGIAPNLQLRLAGLLNYLHGTRKWKQLPNSPSNCHGDPLEAIAQIKEFARQHPTAIISVLGSPMRSGKWEDFINTDDRLRNITLVCGDAMPNQLAFLDRGYVDGLVGQLPYEMGYRAMEQLFQIKTGVSPQQQVMGTNVLIHLWVPLVLPKLIVNNNLIGNLKYVGYILFGIVGVSAIVFSVWTWRNRNAQVVKVSQPMFLILVASGVFIMASSLVPMSQDDSGRQACETDKCTAICMSVPWLGFMGFTMTFTALFAKTWRINRIFKTKVAFGRVKIAAKDVLTFLAVLLTANAIVLTCWTIMDPLTYTRNALEGTDGWNRVIATYGSCHSHRTAAFLIPLAVLTFGVLFVANWQAFKARAIQSKFSESKYIAIAIASMLQAAFIGVPTLFVVRKSPDAYFLILTFMLFVISMAVLMLIFIPKIVIHQNFQRLSPAEQRRFIRNSIHLSRSPNSSLRQSQLFIGLSVGVASQLAHMRQDLDPEGPAANNDHSMLVVDTSHEEYRNMQMNNDSDGEDGANEILDQASASNGSENETQLVAQELSSTEHDDKAPQQSSRQTRWRCQ